MNAYLVIYFIIGYAIWIIVPIRQFGQKYFLFFLTLLTGDILTLITREAFHSRSNIFYLIFGILCFISVQEKRNSRIIKIIVMLLSAASIIIEYKSLGYKYEFILISICNLLLFFKFLKHFIINFSVERKFNIFFACLVFYEILAVTKLLNIVSSLVNAAVYFDTATFVQMVIGIFFCIYKQDDKKMQVSMK